jgi:hypothetical protein
MNGYCMILVLALITTSLYMHGDGIRQLSEIFVRKLIAMKTFLVFAYLIMMIRRNDVCMQHDMEHGACDPYRNGKCHCRFEGIVSGLN